MTPHDQFDHCKEELRKLSRLVDIIEQSIETAENLETFDAKRALTYAQHDIETAQMWLCKAIKVLTPKVPT